tara:strand:- start:16712 stop:18025 length:1314 start_codon:yes stop_codon:yes gene_type:complete
MTAQLQKLSWEDVRDKVKNVNEPLFNEIEKISPDKSMPFYIAKYRFGDQIIINGTLQIPNDKGTVVPITDSSLSKTVKNDLNYTMNMPLGIVLEKSIELHGLVNSRIIPWRILKPGRLFSLWGSFQPSGTSSHAASMWQMTAGARSMFMLSKIEEKRGYQKLQKALGIDIAIPREPYDQWHLFKEIVHAPSTHCEWQTELLFFSREFREKLDTESFNSLTNHLFRTAWLDTTLVRDQIIFDSMYNSAIMSCNIKSNPYLINTTKHIYELARNSFPGLAFATDDSAGPINLIQDVFVDIYGHLKSSPSMMVPAYLNDADRIYYSLNIPTLLSFSAETKPINNQLYDLSWIKVLQDKINAYFKKDEFNLSGTPIANLANSVGYQYFHPNPGKHNDIVMAKNLQHQHAILCDEEKKFNLPFSANSKFMHGVIEIGNLGNQ